VWGGGEGVNGWEKNRSVLNLDHRKRIRNKTRGEVKAWIFFREKHVQSKEGVRGGEEGTGGNSTRHQFLLR